MFATGSRYHGQPTDVIVHRGVNVMAVRPPLPAAASPIGFHRHTPEERLDMLAAEYLTDPTAFWRVCDANNAMAPVTLSTRPLLAIPAKAG